MLASTWVLHGGGSTSAAECVTCVYVRSPMTRVVKVLTAAAKNRWRAARRRKEARARTGYSGPVNLPPGALDGHPGIGAAMARVRSYEWLQSAAEQPDEDGALSQNRPAYTLLAALKHSPAYAYAVHVLNMSVPLLGLGAQTPVVPKMLSLLPLISSCSKDQLWCSALLSDSGTLFVNCGVLSGKRV